MRNKKGFTLIELAIVIFLIGFLVFAFISFSNIKDKAFSAAYIRDIKSVQANIKKYQIKFQPSGMGIGQGTFANCIKQKEFKNQDTNICRALFLSADIPGNIFTETEPNGTTVTEADPSSAIVYLYQLVATGFVNEPSFLFANFDTGSPRYGYLNRSDMKTYQYQIDLRGFASISSSMTYAPNAIAYTGSAVETEQYGLHKYLPSLNSNVKFGVHYNSVQNHYTVTVHDLSTNSYRGSNKITISTFSSKIIQPIFTSQQAYLLDKKYDDGKVNDGLIIGTRAISNFPQASKATYNGLPPSTAAENISNTTQYSCYNVSAASSATPIPAGITNQNVDYTSIANLFAEGGTNTVKTKAQKEILLGCNLTFIQDSTV